MKLDRKTAIKFVQSGILFLLLIAATGYVIFHNNSPKALLDCMKQAQPRYLLAGMALMCVFISAEANNVARCLRLMGYECGILQRYKYALTGFFFSSITPSASGGQPMQAYSMYRDGIDVSHSSLALLIELASYQFVEVLFALIGLIGQYALIHSQLSQIRYVFMLGIALNTLILLLLLTAIFSKDLLQRCVMGVCRITAWFSKTKAQRLEHWAAHQMEEYRRSARYFHSNKKTMVKIVCTTAIQLLSLNSVTYLVYLSFGLTEYSYFTVLAMQSILYITVSALPLPGAVGASESGFVVLFQSLFPAAMLGSAMLLSRIISFYLCVLISGICLGLICAYHARRPIRTVRIVRPHKRKKSRAIS